MSSDSSLIVLLTICTPSLHVASDQAYIDVVNALLSSGADMELRDCDGFSALHFAAREGHEEICKRLLSEGESVHYRLLKN